MDLALSHCSIMEKNAGRRTLTDVRIRGLHFSGSIQEPWCLFATRFNENVLADIGPYCLEAEPAPHRTRLFPAGAHARERH